MAYNSSIATAKIESSVLHRSLLGDSSTCDVSTDRFPLGHSGDFPRDPPVAILGFFAFIIFSFTSNSAERTCFAGTFPSDTFSM